jgi:hypothetical protein
MAAGRAPDGGVFATRIVFVCLLTRLIEGTAARVVPRAPPAALPRQLRHP